MIELSPQIPFELFEAEASSFANFLVGRNEELVTRLYSLSQSNQLHGVITIWSGASTGKTHLLESLFSELIALENWANLKSAIDDFSGSPFIDTRILLLDDADRYDETQQAWAFNAFNHVLANGGLVVATGKTAPAQWPIRDDLRTRLASGLIYELLTPPDEELPELLREYAQKRGVGLSEEVLTYILHRTERNVSFLTKTIAGIDRTSLALKRPITVPLVRAFLSQQTHAGDQKRVD
jgi:DnaA-homolog protein